MKAFILQCLFWGAIIALLHIGLALMADGSTDYYYQKFTTPKQSSLVIGTSRALQGIVPEAVDSSIQHHSYSPLYNFAFTVFSSPFGETYYDAVRNKVSDSSQGGYFIVTVDPWSISQRYQLNEVHGLLGNFQSFSSRPNFEYLMTKYNKGWGNIALRKLEIAFLLKNKDWFNNSVNGSFGYVTETGWLKVYPSMDSTFIANKARIKFNTYQQTAANSSFSQDRLDYLVKTISYLKEHGDVYLVRLPVPAEMLNIENQYMSDFESRIAIAKDACQNYLDMNTLELKTLRYHDGNHLHQESAGLVSKEIGKWITSLR